MASSSSSSSGSNDDESDSGGLPPYFYPPRYLPGTNPSDPQPSWLLGPINIIDDIHPPGPDEPLTPDEELYLKALTDSEGFGMPRFPTHVGFYNPIFAVPVEGDLKTKFYHYSAEAINHYNNKHGTCYRVVKVIKATQQAVEGFNYYITFEAQIDEAAATDLAIPTIQTFEALVNEPYEYTIVTLENQARVILCRVQGDKRVPVFEDTCSC